MAGDSYIRPAAASFAAIESDPTHRNIAREQRHLQHLLPRDAGLHVERKENRGSNFK